MTVTQVVTPVTADPLLHWKAIAEHARSEHGARWASDDEAIMAIIGAFDAILPDGCAYAPVTGAIKVRADKAVPGLWAWGDVQVLNCAAATLAVAAPSCDLETLYGTENLLTHKALHAMGAL